MRSSTFFLTASCPVEVHQPPTLWPPPPLVGKIPFHSSPAQRPWEASRQRRHFSFHRALTFLSGEYSDGRQLRFYPLQHRPGPFSTFGSCKTVLLIFWTDLEAHGVVQTIAGRCLWVPFRSSPETQQWPDAVLRRRDWNIGFCGLNGVLRADKSAAHAITLGCFAQANLTTEGKQWHKFRC